MQLTRRSLWQAWLYQGYLSGDLKQLYDTAVNRRAEIRLIPVSVGAAVIVVFLIWWATGRRAVYLVDFTVYKAPDHLLLTKERFLQGSRDCGVRPARGNRACCKHAKVCSLSAAADLQLGFHERWGKGETEASVGV